MGVVILKNKQWQEEAFVSTVMHKLEDLMNENIFFFYHLVMKCRNPDYQIPEQTLASLQEYELIEPDGSVHDAIRDVVLSGVEGELLKMRLTSPLLEGLI